MVRVARTGLLIAQAFVVLTASGGGLALVAGSLNPTWGSVLVPPDEYLAGSPFTSYVVPGVILIVLVAGLHAIAFASTISDSRWGSLTSATAGFACVIWVFVQMVFIPFSFLQVVYVTVGLLELGLTMIVLGILGPMPSLHRSTYVPMRVLRTPHSHD